MATILYALPQLAGVLTFMVVGLVTPGSLSAGRLFASLVLFQVGVGTRAALLLL
jgi:hypothetical protein